MSRKNIPLNYPVVLNKKFSFVLLEVSLGQVENVENAEKDEKVVKCKKSCLLNQNMGKKPL